MHFKFLIIFLAQVIIILLITACGDTQTISIIPANVSDEPNPEPRNEGSGSEASIIVKEGRSEARLRELEAFNKILVDNVEILASNVHDLESKRVYLEKNVLDLETTIIEHEIANKELTKNNLTLEATVSEVVEMNTSLEKDVATLETTTIQLKEDQRGLIDDKAILSLKVTDVGIVNKKLFDLNANLETTIIEHEIANKELTKNNLTLEATVSEVVEMNTLLEKDVAALETTTIQLKEDQRGLIDDKVVLSLKVTDIGIVNKQLLDLNANLEASLKAKVTINQNLTNDNEALASQVSNLIHIANVPKPGKMITSRTYAGSNECLPIPADNAFCIEILAPDVDPEILNNIQEGIYHAAKLFPVSQEELTTEIGVQDYIGITLWNSETSDLSSLARDNCLFRYDIGGGRSDCEEILISMFDMTSGAKAGNANIFSSSGFTILAPHVTWSRYANNDVESHRLDFRKILAHEYFHSYQQAHRLRVPEQIRPALWLIEGSAEYAGNLIAADAGWIDWGHALRWSMDVIQAALNDNPALSISMNENKQQLSEVDIRFQHIVTYEMGFWATAFAASISSNEAILKYFWDDLAEYGWKESFRRNVGYSVEDFYDLFEQFLADRTEGESVDWLSKFNLENIKGELNQTLAQ